MYEDMTAGTSSIDTACTHYHPDGTVIGCGDAQEMLINTHNAVVEAGRVASRTADMVAKVCTATGLLPASPAPHQGSLVWLKDPKLFDNGKNSFALVVDPVSRKITLISATGAFKELTILFGEQSEDDWKGLADFVNQHSRHFTAN